MEFSAFEWDDKKRQTNVAKHKIDFVDATEVFADPKQFTYRSPHGLIEARFISVGSVHGTLMAVVFTHRGDRIRIISARAARKNERQYYDRQTER